MKGKVILWLLSMAILSCEFPMTEENFVKLSEEPILKVSIKLLNLPDTLDVIDNLTIEYELDIKSTPAGGIYARVGNQIGYVGQAFKGSFMISNYNDQIQGRGYLPFEFYVIATTGTGSLADKSQREVKVFSVKKTLYFDNSPPVPIAIKEIKVVNGSVYLTWDKYPFRNLSSLKITVIRLKS